MGSVQSNSKDGGERAVSWLCHGELSRCGPAALQPRVAPGTTLVPAYGEPHTGSSHPTRPAARAETAASSPCAALPA